MAIKILRPYSVITNTFSGWSLIPAVGGPSTIVEAVDPGDPVAHDDAGSAFRYPTANILEELGMQHDLNFAEKFAAINSVKFYWRARRSSGSGNHWGFRLFLGGNNSTSTGYTLTTSFADFEWDATNDRPGGGDWTEDDFRDTTLEWRWRSSAGGAEQADITSVWAAIDYVPKETKVEDIRRVLSRRLRLLRRPLSVITLEVGAEFLDVQIGEIINLSHFALPHASGGGTRIKSWQRRSYIVTRNDFNPNTMRCRLTLVDTRHFALGLWDVAISDISASGSDQSRDGIASLDAGATRNFLRASAAWAEDPGDGRIVKFLSNKEKNSADGHLLEQSATNETLNSAFDNGIDSGDWTLQGEGTNGSALDDDTSDTFWDTDETAQSLKMTAGDPLGGTDLAITQTTGTINANTVCSLSVTHEDDSGNALTLEITRAIDGWYYNAATPGWQSGAVDNDLTVRSSATRDDIRGIDVGGTNTTVTYKVKVNTTAGQINHVYDVQFEQTRYPTSRILTNNATITREDDEFYYSNDIGSRTWYPMRGTAFIQVKPPWSSSDLASGAKPTLFYCSWDATNYEWVYYDEANSRWTYERKAGGTSYYAYSAGSVTAGTWYSIAPRWTSGEGEFDLSNYTTSLFVDGTKGTDATPGAAPPHTNADLQIGRTAADTNMIDAWVKQIYITPQVLTDEEVARLP